MKSIASWVVDIQSTKKMKYVLKTEKESMGGKIFLSMLMHEQDIGEGYMVMCYDYDTNMAMLNHGFLTLVKMEFFNWGRDLIHLMRSSLSEKDIDNDPKNYF